MSFSGEGPLGTRVPLPLAIASTALLDPSQTSFGRGPSSQCTHYDDRKAARPQKGEGTIAPEALTGRTSFPWVTATDVAGPFAAFF